MSDPATPLTRNTNTTQRRGRLKNAKMGHLNTSPEAGIAILTSDKYNLRKKKNEEG